MSVTWAEAMKNLAASTKAFRRSLEATTASVGKALQLFAAGFKRATPFARAFDIARFGPGNEDGSGVWLSDLCSAWVHESCPSRFCGCTCHGGER